MAGAERFELPVSESKSDAFPLGYAPVRWSTLRDSNPLPRRERALS